MNLTFIAVRQENPTKSIPAQGGLKNYILNCSTKRILYPAVLCQGNPFNLKEREQPMGQTDITEKILEDYNDVFADIINGLIFNGEQRILPDIKQRMEKFMNWKGMLQNTGRTKK